MNRRNLMDLINCDSEDKEKMIEAVREKLRWYTFEASEEEFDTEAVDALVKFLREVEPELGKTSEKENDKPEREQKKRVIKLNRGRIAAAVVIGALVLTLASVIVGNSLGTSLAWEEGGFFRWLRKDEKGQTMITSPEDLGMEDGKKQKYEKFEEVPEKYQQYLLDRNDIEEIVICETSSATRICEKVVSSEQFEIEVGVTIYESEIIVVREKYDYLKYQYSKLLEEETVEVWVKENEDKNVEYTLLWYIGNMKFFVTGLDEIDILEEIVREYLEKILR